MCLDNMVKYAQIFAYAVTGIALLFSARTYYYNTKVKRGEWLKTLFEKFFETDKFGEVRKQIEYNTLKSYLGVDDKGMCAKTDEEEKLVNYLNFFEFISILEERGHISKNEVNDLFGYFIEAIKKESFLQGYIKQFGFENLEKKIG